MYSPLTDQDIPAALIPEPDYYYGAAPRPCGYQTLPQMLPPGHIPGETICRMCKEEFTSSGPQSRHKTIRGNCQACINDLSDPSKYVPIYRACDQ